MTVEVFSAVAQCPKCGSLGVHWLDSPRVEPVWDDSPVSLMQRSLVRHQEMVNAVFGNRRYYDPPETAVARVCLDCEHRWAQA